MEFIDNVTREFYQRFIITRESFLQPNIGKLLNVYCSYKRCKISRNRQVVATLTAQRDQKCIQVFPEGRANQFLRLHNPLSNLHNCSSQRRHSKSRRKHNSLRKESKAERLEREFKCVRYNEFWRFFSIKSFLYCNLLWCCHHFLLEYVFFRSLDSVSLCHPFSLSYNLKKRSNKYCESFATENHYASMRDMSHVHSRSEPEANWTRDNMLIE